MCNKPDPNYKEMYEKLAKAVSDANVILLGAEADCADILYDSNMADFIFPKEADERMRSFLQKLRFPSEYQKEADFKRMYLSLLNHMLSALEYMERENYSAAKRSLQKGIASAEDIYIEAE